MDTLLLFVIAVLLWLDLDEHESCHQAVIREHGSIRREVRTAEHRLEKLTQEALNAMLAEARRWQPRL